MFLYIATEESVSVVMVYFNEQRMYSMCAISSRLNRAILPGNDR